MQGSIGDADDFMDLGSDMLTFDIDATANPTNASANSDDPGHGSASMHNMQLSQQNVHPSVEVESGTYPSQDSAGITSTSNPIGAGPLPHSYGIQGAQATGSTVTDFTKRRNWSQRVLEELRDFLYILSPDGRMLYASPSVKGLTGFETNEIVGRLISDFIHPDDINAFVREFNESIASHNALRFFFRFRKKDEQYMIFESHGHPHHASEGVSFGQNAGASFCRGFFMMARPYPTKNAALLDSFLEHKIENERLRKRIADLKREEQEEMEGHQQQWLSQQIGYGTSPSSPFPQMMSSERPSNTPNYDGMPPPARPSLSNTALTRQNLDEALAASRPDSINDKMARYEGTNHLETIEMLTGLKYREGERSKGISTGAASPTLIRGDAGIAILVDKDGRPTQGSRGELSGSPYPDGMSSDKKKKVKVADEYVCTDCGTLDSPEWRKGPNGPKTLCNACGLRWAKKEKKELKRSGSGFDTSNGQGQGGEASVPPIGNTPMQSQNPLPPVAPMPAPNQMGAPPPMPMDAGVSMQHQQHQQQQQPQQQQPQPQQHQQQQHQIQPSRPPLAPG